MEQWTGSKLGNECDKAVYFITSTRFTGSMCPKAHLTSHFRISDSRWVTTQSWLSESLRPFSDGPSVCFFFLLNPIYLDHGPNIPGSYAMLFFTALDFIFTTRHIHNWTSFRFSPATSFCLELLVIALNSSPVAYWMPSDLGGSSSSVISFCLFILFMWFYKQE